MLKFVVIALVTVVVSSSSSVDKATERKAADKAAAKLARAELKASAAMEVTTTKSHLELISEELDAAKNRIIALTDATGSNPSPTHLLELYGLFKQATVGDAPEVKSSFFAFLDPNRKWMSDSWASMKGKSARHCVARYNAIADEICLAYETEQSERAAAKAKKEKKKQHASKH